MPSVISKPDQTLINELICWRKEKYPDKVEQLYNAYLIGLDWTDMYYLTSKGQVIIYSPDGDLGSDILICQPCQLQNSPNQPIPLDISTTNCQCLKHASQDEATRALLMGHKRTSIDELLALIPTAPTDAIQCPMCDGERWVNVFSPGHTMLCFICDGRGWANERLLQRNPHVLEHMDALKEAGKPTT